MGKTRQRKVYSVGLVSLNNFSGLWAIGMVVPSCLVPGPELIRAGGILAGCVRVRQESGWGKTLIGQSAHERQVPGKLSSPTHPKN